MMARQVCLVLLLAVGAVAYRDEPVSKKAKASSQIVGVMKVIVDDYVTKFKDEGTSWGDKKKQMKVVIDKMEDKEGKESAIDEMLKMEKSHDKKLEEYVAFIKSVDEALKTLGSKTWMDDHPDTKTEVEAIYKEYPAALLHFTARVVKPAAHKASLLHANGPEPVSKKAKASNQIVGVMKVIVDDYVSKYKDEEKSWGDKKKQMQTVIDKMKDKEGKESAIDEKLKMAASHDKKLEEYSAFIKSVDEALKALGSETWMDDHPDTKTEVEAIYKEHPAALLRFEVKQ